MRQQFRNGADKHTSKAGTKLVLHSKISQGWKTRGLLEPDCIVEFKQLNQLYIAIYNYQQSSMTEMYFTGGRNELR